MPFRKRDLYIRCFGKYLANSILNGYFVGIEFAEGFVKTLYRQKVSFQDLKDILDQNTIQGYESLENLGDEDFEDL